MAAYVPGDGELYVVLPGESGAHEDVPGAGHARPTAEGLDVRLGEREAGRLVGVLQRNVREPARPKEVAQDSPVVRAHPVRDVGLEIPPRHTVLVLPRGLHQVGEDRIEARPRVPEIADPFPVRIEHVGVERHVPVENAVVRRERVLTGDSLVRLHRREHRVEGDVELVPDVRSVGGPLRVHGHPEIPRRYPLHPDRDPVLRFGKFVDQRQTRRHEASVDRRLPVPSLLFGLGGPLGQAHPDVADHVLLALLPFLGRELPVEQVVPVDERPHRRPGMDRVAGRGGGGRPLKQRSLGAIQRRLIVHPDAGEGHEARVVLDALHLPLQRRVEALRDNPLGVRAELGQLLHGEKQVRMLGGRYLFHVPAGLSGCGARIQKHRAHHSNRCGDQQMSCSPAHASLLFCCSHTPARSFRADHV